MKKLRGTNEIEQFREIGKLLKRKIASFEDVCGIVFMGGLVRGFADKYSDVDAIVLLKERDEALRQKIKEIGLDEARRAGVDVDLEVHFLEEIRTRKWSEIARWDFSHARIAFDREGEVEKLFRTKLNVPSGFWLRRIVTYGEYVG